MPHIDGHDDDGWRRTVDRAIDCPDEPGHFHYEVLDNGQHIRFTMYGWDGVRLF